MNKSQLVVDDHIRVFLKNGLKILNGLYEFFCYSASQLRDYSVWMVKLEKDFNPFAIFDKIGNYYKEKNISKYASRRGLICTTAIFVGVVENIKILDDIYALEDFNDGIETKKKEELNFTDGCGTISVDLAKLAAKRFNLEFA